MIYLPSKFSSDPIMNCFAGKAREIIEQFKSNFFSNKNIHGHFLRLIRVDVSIA